MAPPGIDLVEVGVTFGRVAPQVCALDGVTLHVGAKSFTAIVGPSGCGKTTVLRLMGGLIEPTEGSVSVDGGSASAARGKRAFSYVFQNPVLLPWLTVLENVRLLAQMAGQVEQRPAKELLLAVGLGGFEHRYANELSGGMRQRASIARALTLAPQYLLLDEPFGALDDLTRETLEDLLASSWLNSACGCVLVTHNVSEAVYLADQVIVMTGRPGSIKTSISVSFPRPRASDLRMSMPFLEKVREVRQALA